MYKNAKHPFIRIGGWIIMGFLTLVIVISFGMPDFLSRINIDQNVAAIVNGKKIYKMEIARIMRQMRGDGSDAANADQKSQQILFELVNQCLQTQFAYKLGVRVSEDVALNFVATKFPNDEAFTRYTDSMGVSRPTLLAELKDRIVANEGSKLIYGYGVGVSSDEVLFQNAVNNSKFQVRFAFVSNDDLKKRFGGSVAVTDKEIDDEMAKNKKEIKDPATDRERFRGIIADRKLEQEKKTLVKSVDDVAAKNGTFEAAAALIGGKVAVSDTFKAGDPVKEPGKDAKPLYSLSDSDIFRSDFAAIKPGIASRAVSGHEGIYVFTPVKKDIQFDAPKEEEAAKISDMRAGELQQWARMAMYKPFYEKSDKRIYGFKTRESE